MQPVPQLLEEAAAPTLERIRRDRERAPPQIRPLLAYLETHLFDADLDAQQLKRACGVRDNTLSIRFHKALSRPPYAYIEDCRMDVACRLLARTDLKVWRIAQLLGYSAVQVFSRAFDRWSGLRPSVFRLRCGRPASAGEAPPLQVETLLRAVRGGLEKHEADELSRQLAMLYPGSFRPLPASQGESTATP